MTIKEKKGHEKKKSGKNIAAALGGIILTGSLFLGACGVQAKTAAEGDMLSAEETAECVMESMRSLDLERFNQYTDNYIQTVYNWSGVPVRSEYHMFNELLQPGTKTGKAKEKYEFHHTLYEKMLENLTWEIKSVEENGERAEIVMEITNIDMNGLMARYERSILEDMIAGEGSGLGQMIKDLSHILDEDDGLMAMIDACDKEDTCTCTVTAVAYRENGVWILRLDDELQNACMGLP